MEELTLHEFGNRPVSFSFLKKFLNWSIVILQSFRYLAYWFIYVYTHTHTHTFCFRFFSTVGYNKILDIVPCAIQQVPGLLFFFFFKSIIYIYTYYIYIVVYISVPHHLLQLFKKKEPYHHSQGSNVWGRGAAKTVFLS